MMITDGTGPSDGGAPGARGESRLRAIVERGNRSARALCDLLERIADSLPHEWSPAEIEAATGQLERALRTHVFVQESLLFPALRRKLAADHALAALLAQSEHEHAVDQCLALELTEALDAVVATRTVANPEMLGYMLRCFFQAQRRHMAWEALLVADAAWHVLTDDEIRRLAALAPE